MELKNWMVEQPETNQSKMKKIHKVFFLKKFQADG